MIISSFLQYQDMPLTQLTDRLEKYYYELVDIIVKHCDKNLEKIYSSEPNTEAANFINDCRGMLGSIQKYLDTRINVTIPYLNELAKKDAESHNCANCTGNCELQHTVNFIEYTASLDELKATTQYLRTNIIKQINNYPSLKQQNNKMILLHGLLNELVYIEEHILLQKIKTSQKNIHVAS